MRTTVTLDADVQALIDKAMRERGLTFKQAVNGAIRTGLGRKAAKYVYRTPTFSMGARPGVNLDKANQLAGQLEDEEIIRKMRLGK